MQIGSVVWEEFCHIHTYIHTYTHTHIHTHGICLSIRVTLNTKPASQVLIITKMIQQKLTKTKTKMILITKTLVIFPLFLHSSTTTLTTKSLSTVDQTDPKQSREWVTQSDPWPKWPMTHGSPSPGPSPQALHRFIDYPALHLYIVYVHTLLRYYIMHM